MGIYRTFRSLVVDAVQCTETRTFATDLGFINVRQGEWVICGEGGESYVVDDAFFRRTFVPIDTGSRTVETEDPDQQVQSPETEREGIAAGPRNGSFGVCHRSRSRRPLRRQVRAVWN